jgi:ketosteroid isomerase-like protein
MKQEFFKSICLVLTSLILFSCSAIKPDPAQFIPAYKPDNLELYKTIASLDSTYFAAYNSCNMAKQAEMYAEDIEFFHDRGGLMTSKRDLLASIEKNICGKVTRTLVKGSIEVYPIHGYGAVEIGYHSFYNKQEPDAPMHPSKFIMIWHLKDGQWKINKVISLH